MPKASLVCVNSNQRPRSVIAELRRNQCPNRTPPHGSWLQTDEIRGEQNEVHRTETILGTVMEMSVRENGPSSGNRRGIAENNVGTGTKPTPARKLNHRSLLHVCRSYMARPEYCARKSAGLNCNDSCNWECIPRFDWTKVETETELDTKPASKLLPWASGLRLTGLPHSCVSAG